MVITDKARERQKELCRATLKSETTWRTHCGSRAAVGGVDGQPYCRMHARLLERELDAWAAEAARYATFNPVPDWLPESRHAEWRQLRRDYWYSSVREDSETAFADSIYAITRMHQITKAHENGGFR